jgi:hypothetical protein
MNGIINFLLIGQVAGMWVGLQNGQRGVAHGRTQRNNSPLVKGGGGEATQSLCRPGVVLMNREILHLGASSFVKRGRSLPLAWGIARRPFS